MAGAAAAAIPIIGGIVGGVLQARAEKLAAEAKSRVRLQQANELEVTAIEVRETGRVAAGLRMNQIKAARASARASAANRGIAIGVGSAEVVPAQIDTLGKLDALTIRYNAERKAQAIDREVKSMRDAAGEELVVGDALRVARAVQSGFGGAASALQSVSLGGGFKGFGASMERVSDTYGANFTNPNYQAIA